MKIKISTSSFNLKGFSGKSTSIFTCLSSLTLSVYIYIYTHSHTQIKIIIINTNAYPDKLERWEKGKSDFFFAIFTTVMSISIMVIGF